MTKKIIAIILVISAALMLAAPAGAAGVTITETVNVAAARQNMRGHGYEWANRTSVLTLNGLSIDTDSDYGLRLPADCTVILEGDNYVKASKYALSCAGNVVFKGKGTLTLDAGMYGIYLISQDNTTKVRMLSGEYDIRAGKYGVFSEYTDFSVSGGKFTVSTDGEDGRAIMGRVVSLVGGSFTADSPLECTHTLTVDSVNISVEADRPALSAKNLIVRHLDPETYGGENTISAKAVKRWHSKSILFGNDAAAWLDYIVLAAVVIALAACIVIPVLVKKKKREKLYEELRANGYDTYRN